MVNAFIFSAILEGLADNARYKAQLLRATKEVEHRWAGVEPLASTRGRGWLAQSDTVNRHTGCVSL